MSKYIKLEDTIERRNELYHCYEVEEWLKSLPTIEIVHCKDCKRYESDGGAMMVCDITGNPTSDNDFCSWAERRE